MKKYILTFILILYFPFLGYNDDCCKYMALISSVCDGDTVTGTVYLGLGVAMVQKMRLSGIDAPEIKTKDTKEKEAGYLARDALAALLLDQEVMIKTDVDKVGKYGRLIVTIFIDVNGELVDVNKWMVESGYAVYKDY